MTTDQPDRLAQLDAVRRSVDSRTRDGAATKVVTVAQDYPVGVGELWQAVTTAERISRWLMPVSGDLRLGGRYQLEGNAGGQVLECEQAQRLAVTWEFAGEVSWVVATLTGDDESSTLRVEHEAPVDQERWDQYGPGAVGIGWDSMFLGLALHLASGGSSREGAEEWVASSEGRAFMSRSGAAWLGAQVAAGEDEQSARAAAERCLAAYLG